MLLEAALGVQEAKVTYTNACVDLHHREAARLQFNLIALKELMDSPGFLVERTPQ